MVNLLPATVSAFAGVAFCLWMFFSSLYTKTPEGSIEITLPKDGSKRPWGYYEAMEQLRLQLRYDAEGRLLRWVGDRQVHSDVELMAEIDNRRSDRWDLPVGIDALPDMSWREIVRAMCLCEKRGFRVEIFAPIER